MLVAALRAYYFWKSVNLDTTFYWSPFFLLPRIGRTASKNDIKTKIIKILFEKDKKKT